MVYRGRSERKGGRRIYYIERFKKIKWCERCVLEKAHKQSFRRGLNTQQMGSSSTFIQIFGVPLNFLQVFLYFITFIDDSSRNMCKIFFKKNMNHSRNSGMEYERRKQDMQEGTCLKIDNNLEYCKDLFHKFCKPLGIKRHNTCTPQQNGVYEMLNRTIMNKVRSLFAKKGLVEKFWAGAASTAVYLINRAPSSSIEVKATRGKISRY